MINIAIDGPSGSGKSTLAKNIAERMHINYLDTGAMYRAVGYAALAAGIEIKDEKQVNRFLNSIILDIEYNNGNQTVFVDGVNVMENIRTPLVSKAASDISVHSSVRQKLTAMQRKVAKKYDVVLDGRDIGTHVLPGAEYKFFITADLKERARRRHKELEKNKIVTSYQTVLDDMEKRDAADSGRKLAPLKKAVDAILIDTTCMTPNEVLNFVMKKIEG